MKVAKSKFIGACHECGEAAKNQISLDWSGQTIRLCEKHMLYLTARSKASEQIKPTKPKKEIY